MAQEKLLFNIPADNEWHSGDVEKKAEELGFANKSEFMLAAVDMMMGFDEVFFKKIKEAAEGYSVPIWTYIENTIIEKFAQTAAKVEAGTWRPELHHEFMYVSEASKETGVVKNRIITGEELFNNLKHTFLDEEKKKFKTSKERHDFFVSESERLKKEDEK